MIVLTVISEYAVFPCRLWLVYGAFLPARYGHGFRAARSTGGKLRRRFPHDPDFVTLP